MQVMSLHSAGFQTVNVPGLFGAGANKKQFFPDLQRNERQRSAASIL
jgi:hypothetical protein